MSEQKKWQAKRVNSSATGRVTFVGAISRSDSSNIVRCWIDGDVYASHGDCQMQKFGAWRFTRNTGGVIH